MRTSTHVCMSCLLRRSKLQAHDHDHDHHGLYATLLSPARSEYWYTYKFLLHPNLQIYLKHLLHVWTFTTTAIKMNNKLQAIPRPFSARLEEESKRASSRPFPRSNTGSLPRSILVALKYNGYCTFLGKGYLTKFRDSRQVVMVLVCNAAETNKLVAFA